MSEKHAPDPIIPPVPERSPDDLLRAVMGVERKKVLDAEKREAQEKKEKKGSDG